MLMMVMPERHCSDPLSPSVVFIFVGDDVVSEREDVAPSRLLTADPAAVEASKVDRWWVSAADAVVDNDEFRLSETAHKTFKSALKQKCFTIAFARRAI
jgi:hypothetical protein